MTTIYHNPRCSKSRSCLLLLEDLGPDIEVINYIKNPLTEKELKRLIQQLGISPIDLIRKNEKDWKENYKGKSLNDQELIKAMLNNPKLIERPIVVKDNKAIIARPPELVLEFV